MEDRQFKHSTDVAGQSCSVAEEGLTSLFQKQVFVLKALANCFAPSPATPKHCSDTLCHFAVILLLHVTPAWTFKDVAFNCSSK